MLYILFTRLPTLKVKDKSFMGGSGSHVVVPTNFRSSKTALKMKGWKEAQKSRTQPLEKEKHLKQTNSFGGLQPLVLQLVLIQTLYLGMRIILQIVWQIKVGFGWDPQS